MMTYENPIIKGFYPDPSICRVGEWFYLVTSSFEFFPGVPLFKSKDLIHWQQIGHVLSRASQLNLEKIEKSAGIFAPTIRHHEGRFYMVTTVSGKGGNFFVWTDDIEGEWSDPIWVEVGGIDPDFYFEDDKLYITTNEHTTFNKCGLVMAEIDAITGDVVSDKKYLWGGTGGRAVEAPHIYKKDGWYYILAAEGGTEYGHMITIGRSKELFGPYEGNPNNPILTHKNYWHSIQSTGHGDLVEDLNGQWWIVFLGIRPSKRFFHHMGRETFLAPVSWDEDGWPVVNDNKGVELQMKCDQLPETFIVEQEAEMDKFEGDTFRHSWNWLRNPVVENYQIGNEGLTLIGTPIKLGEQDTPTMIMRRQQAFECQATAKLEVDQLIDGDRTGLTVYYSEEHHYEVYIEKSGEQLYAVVERHVADMNMTSYREVYVGSTCVLAIKADKDTYHLCIGETAESLKEVAKGTTQLMSVEASNRLWTGNYFGIYVISDKGTQVKVPWFEYKHL